MGAPIESRVEYYSIVTGMRRTSGGSYRPRFEHTFGIRFTDQERDKLVAQFKKGEAPRILERAQCWYQGPHEDDNELVFNERYFPNALIILIAIGAIDPDLEFD